MTVWLDVARAAAGANIAVLLMLGGIWIRNYRRHGASHTLALAVFAGVLLLENLLWLYFYVIHQEFVNWYVAAGTDVQIGVTLLCGLELVALLFVLVITWR